MNPWSWEDAMATARSLARIDKRRYRVTGYRTGSVNYPWGYAVRPIGGRRG